MHFSLFSPLHAPSRNAMNSKTMQAHYFDFQLVLPFIMHIEWDYTHSILYENRLD